MKRLTRKEAASLRTKPPGKMSETYAYIAAMDVGDFILLERSDWKHRKRSPVTLMKRVEKRLDRSYRLEIMLDGSGWVVERLT